MHLCVVVMIYQRGKRCTVCLHRCPVDDRAVGHRMVADDRRRVGPVRTISIRLHHRGDGLLLVLLSHPISGSGIDRPMRTSSSSSSGLFLLNVLVSNRSWDSVGQKL